MSTAKAGHRHHYGWSERDGFRFRFLVQRRMAAAAIVIDGAELNQQAAIATDDLPRVYRGKSRGHRVVGVPERALLTTNSRVKPGEEILLCASICGRWAVEVKGKMRNEEMMGGAGGGDAAESRATAANPPMMHRTGWGCLLSGFLRRHDVSSTIFLRR